MSAAERMMQDFEKSYAAMTYHGATKNEIFRDWLYDRLLEVYELEIKLAAAPQSGEAEGK